MSVGIIKNYNYNHEELVQESIRHYYEKRSYPDSLVRYIYDKCYFYLHENGHAEPEYVGMAVEEALRWECGCGCANDEEIKYLIDQGIEVEIVSIDDYVTHETVNYILNNDNVIKLLLQECKKLDDISDKASEDLINLIKNKAVEVETDKWIEAIEDAGHYYIKYSDRICVFVYGEYIEYLLQK